ncbi:MAG: ATP-dependent DNA helicase RecG [Ruminococcaceae bacterium]|nr:ATP-dependent DNA helicase RecG [Oscillospiraceae bacterium]
MAGSVLNTSVTKLKGVGPVKAAAYAKQGIFTAGDLLVNYPRAYENRGNIELLDEITDPDIKHAVVLTVATEPKGVRLRSRHMSMLKFKAYDDSGTAEITFFNQDYLKDKFPLGSTFRFWGKVERVGRHYAMSAPAFEPWYDDKPLRDLIPIYRLSEGLNQKQITENIAQAAALCGQEIPDDLPNDIRIENKLCTRTFALKNIHNPENFVSLAAAKKRLIFDEFFTFGLGMALTRAKVKKSGAPECRDNDLVPFSRSLPFPLTEAQKRAIREIRADMATDSPMNRILIGDVGCGKTVCAAAAVYIAVKSGYQAALMAPTEILARQHYADLSDILGKLGYSVELLIGATSASKKTKIKAALTDGTLDFVIGTQALLSDGVEFARPGLIVTDEQHRFGVMQRATLSEKSKNAHTLVMSATPIPRSLALAFYGDLDMSVIDEMPPGRQRVDTFYVDGSYRARLEGFIDKNVREGGQVYIVCPAVEEKESADDEVTLDEMLETGIIPDTAPPLKAAVKYAEEIQARFPEFKVEFVHGKLKSRDKEAIMARFAAGKTQILVSTTVIEVGVNVPNACLMIVENAERFGLSQLHQLRGRVGRGKRKSYCVLVYGGDDLALCSENAKERLETMKTCYDGFAIAEKDLAMRGPGDFLRGNGDDTVRQSGGVKFKIADMCDDAGILTAAFVASKKLLEEDPELSNHPELRDTVTSMFTLDRTTVN